jgi:hypothetical protein
VWLVLLLFILFSVGAIIVAIGSSDEKPLILLIIVFGLVTLGNVCIVGTAYLQKDVQGRKPSGLGELAFICIMIILAFSWFAFLATIFSKIEKKKYLILSFIALIVVQLILFLLALYSGVGLPALM